MKKSIENELNKIFNQVEKPNRGKEWHKTLKEIIDVYKRTMEDDWYEGKYFLNGKKCIICKDEAHRIIFDVHTLYRFEEQ